MNFGAPKTSMTSLRTLATPCSLAALCALTLAGLGACGPAETTTTCDSDSDCDTGQACVDAQCRARSDGGGSGADASTRPDAGPRLVSVAITPASPVIETLNGAMASVDLDIEATYDDGSSAPIANGFWSVGSALLGSIDAITGVLTANGDLAGSIEVQVETLSMTASTTVQVMVRHVVSDDGVPADAAELFAGTPVTDAARSANLLYPLDATVFPQNVYPPTVQWERGAEGDIYQISVDTPGVSLVAYEVHSGAGFNHAWALPREAWRALAEVSPETPVTLKVDRWVAADDEVVAGVTRTFRFADAVISGSIYYWNLDAGSIERINGDGTGREVFMPSPPARAGDGHRCVACHAVSRDGTRMVAGLWEASQEGAVFDLTQDLTGDPAPTLATPTHGMLTASFSPDNSRLIANQANELFLLDGLASARLTTAGTPLPTTGAAHPTWSPDGSAIAFITATDGVWGVDFTHGDLALIDASADDTFGPQRTIFEGETLVAARPTWSPDSQWLAIQHGEHSRAILSGHRYETSIRLVSRTGTSVDLPRLNGGATNSYYPTYSPFDAGGYHWLAFFSTRDYGNAQAGTQGTGRRQLWVAAVSNTPGADGDPSAAAYWLPQQDVATENMAAFWAEQACRAQGRTCSASAECCGGFCRDRGEGPVCVPQDTVECAESGESCGAAVSCCEGAGGCLSGSCTNLM